MADVVVTPLTPPASVATGGLPYTSGTTWATLADVAKGYALVSGGVTTVPAYQLKPMIDARDYGAMGNGTTDDTAAIQAAFDAARTGGAWVYVPPGSYKIASTLTWYTTADNVQGPIIRGAGPFNTIFLNAVANGPLLSIKSLTLNAFAHATHLSNFGISASGAPAASDGVLLQGLYQIEVARLRINGLTGDGIRVVVASADQDGSVQAYIHDNWISSLTGIGLDVETSGSSVEFSFLDLARNFITGCAGGGVRYSGINGEIRQNAITLCGTFGLRLRYNSSNNRVLHVHNNTFEHNAGPLLDVQSLLGGVIELNEFVNTLAGHTPTALVSFGTAGATVSNVLFQQNFVRVDFALYAAVPGYLYSAGTVQYITVADTRWDQGYAGGQNTRFSTFASITSPTIQDDGILVRGSSSTTGASADEIVIRNARALRGLSTSATGFALAQVNVSDEAEFGSTGLRNTLKGPRTNVSAGRFCFAKGANVAAANDLTLGEDGNVFHITGATQINAITTTQWQAGSPIWLIFDSNPVVKHNTAGGANTAKILLAGSVDFSATANDVLPLVYDGTSWFQASAAAVI